MASAGSPRFGAIVTGFGSGLLVSNETSAVTEAAAVSPDAGTSALPSRYSWFPSTIGVPAWLVAGVAVHTRWPARSNAAYFPSWPVTSSPAAVTPTDTIPAGSANPGR